mgnify:CR=1 FL=1
MPHYRVTLAYDGTDFAGWQAQASDRGRTVQGALEDALARLARSGPSPPERVRVVAAGRTDAGVHAQGQVACFRLEREWRPADLVRALNGLLPADARALQAAVVDDGFHARRSALSKVYRYTLDNGLLQQPTRRFYAGHCPVPLDREKVAAVAGSVPTLETVVVLDAAPGEGAGSSVPVVPFTDVVAVASRGDFVALIKFVVRFHGRLSFPRRARALTAARPSPPRAGCGPAIGIGGRPVCRAAQWSGPVRLSRRRHRGFPQSRETAR